jgi:proline dehydrogenase
VLVRTRPGTGDALRLAAELVDGGFSVALEPEGNAAGFAVRVADAGLAPHCELTVPVDRLGTDEVVALAEVGPALALTGPRDAVTAVAARLPAARVVVPAGEPGAEAWCRSLADRRVRLTAGRGARGDLAFVRCLNVLMAGSGHPAVATTDPGLLALGAVRAAWNDRTPDSWEHVMPDRARSSAGRRLLAAGYRVRVVVGAAG